MVDFSEITLFLQQQIAVLSSILPPIYFSLITLLMFSFLLAIYSILIWKFHKLVSKKDLLTLNLAQYNQADHPFYSKLLAVLLYFAEYILILPLVLSFGFSLLAVILVLLTQDLAASQVILVSVAIVACIRILAYYSEDLSREIAKLLPLTLLAIFLSVPNFFSLERLVSGIAQIGSLFNQIIYFFMFMISLELVLRILDLLFSE